MLLGKRPRHPIKRTTSMTEFSFDDLSIIHHVDPSSPSDQTQVSDHDFHHQNQMVMGLGLASPRIVLHRRNSADFVLQHQSTTFLRTCSLCQRRLAPARDIFMYRGDTAFCSLECRKQQMAQDEWKEKCTAVSSTNKESNSSASTAGCSVPRAKAETVAAL